jgi:hypothetical protein
VPFVSVTRLRLRGARYLPAFTFHTWRAARQIRHAPGFVAGRLAVGAARAYWTLTVWESEAAMRAYRDADAHRRAMPRLLDWCDEAAVAHWEQPDAAIPTLEEAARRLAGSGRPSKVRHPSAAHRDRVTWPDGCVPRGAPPFGPATPRAR